MSAYDHDLEFGVFITPRNDPPERPVELALAAESVGLDLVTFQDHPYQPRFHDTLALLAWTAAVTERVRLASLVHSLPMRPPAVLARAAASIDLLSDGRFELGLGAGAFWDAIEAMGGPRRTPGEALAALEDGIDVVRGIWDTTTQERLEAGGDHYRISGAKRGPSPAHDIGIWVGAYGPRTMDLIGRKADGWVPSIGRISSEDLADRSRRIDDAAVRVGRNPSDIRRIANIGIGNGAIDTPRLVETIAWLGEAYGFSTFVVATDDPAQMETFASEVLPAARRRLGDAR